MEPAEPVAEATPEPQEEIQEEIKETPEETPAAAAPQTVPLPIVMELKHELRDMKQENQQLKQRFEELQNKPQDEVPDPDPVPAYIDSYKKEYYEENGEYPDEDNIPIPAKVILARDEWRERNAQKSKAQTDAQVREQAIANARITMSDEAFGEGLGLDAVVGIGEHFLTEGDKLDIRNAGPKCADVMYRRCYDRAVASGTPQGIALAQKMHAALNPTVKEPPSKPEAPSVNEVLERPKHHHLTSLGLVG